MLDKLLIVVLLLALVVPQVAFVGRPLSQAVLVVVALLSTIPVVIGSLRSIRERKVSVDLLAGVALVASLILKEWNSAIFINLMLASARILDDYSKEKAHSAIKSLLKLRPETVKIKLGGEIKEVHVSGIKAGDLIIITSGERIPVDGTIQSGDAVIDQSSLTGESVPVARGVGEGVLSSTLLVSGSITVRAVKVGADTMFEKLINLVEGAQSAKPKVNTIADKFAAWYVVAVFVAMPIVYLIFGDVKLLLAGLLVACADDIAVAIPLAFLVSISNAAKRGVIVKGANFLEALAKIKTFIVDKTGTLTLAKMRVQDVIAFNDFTKEELLEYAAASEAISDHPVAKAIVEYVKRTGIDFKEPEHFDELPGKGTRAKYKGKDLLSGKLSFLRESGIEISEEYLSQVEETKKSGLNTTLISCGGKIAGFIALADDVRPKVGETIKKLKSEGVTSWIMLTGDNERVAERVATELNITEYHANLLPQDKLEFIKKLSSKKIKIAMVGDGVNDAAALALADVGIAMGAIGSDAAIEAADVALMKDDFSRIAEVIALGKRTMRIAYQNFWIWGMVNVVGFVLVFGHVIGPEGAAAYNFATDFLPLINSLRLFKS